MESLSESQAFTEYGRGSPKAVKPMRGDEQCWKLGYENLYALTVGTPTERPLQQVTQPQTEQPPSQCTNVQFRCFPFHIYFVSKKYLYIHFIFCTFSHSVCPRCPCSSVGFLWVFFMYVSVLVFVCFVILS